MSLHSGLEEVELGGKSIGTTRKKIGLVILYRVPELRRSSTRRYSRRSYESWLEDLRRDMEIFLNMMSRRKYQDTK
jgi:hypothetical protein